MPLYIEFEANNSSVLKDLVVHKLGLNIFLPPQPPEREQKESAKPAVLYLELLVSGIEHSNGASSLKLKIKHLFGNDRCACVDLKEDSNVSEMFLVSTTETKAPSDEDWTSYVNKETLHGFLDDRMSVVKPTLKVSGGFLSFDWHGKCLFPGDIRKPAVGASGKIYLRKQGIDPAYVYDPATFPPPGVCNPGLALWVSWEEPMPENYRNGSTELFEHPCVFPYSGVFKKCASNGAPERVDVEQVEVVVTLPKGCRDDSDYEPLMRVGAASGTSSNRPVSDWVEKKEKVIDPKYLFDKWKGFEPESRRFIVFKASGKDQERELQNREIGAIAYDHRGDMQRQSDLTIAGVVVAVALGIVFNESQYLQTCWETRRWSMFSSTPVSWLAAWYAIIPFLGFMYIDFRVHGRRWITEDCADAAWFWKRTLWPFKAFVRMLMRGAPPFFMSWYRPQEFYWWLRWLDWRPRSIHRLLFLTLLLVIAFEYMVFSKEGLRDFCPLPTSQEQKKSEIRMDSGTGAGANHSQPFLQPKPVALAPSKDASEPKAAK